jgi:hypothetical protein
LEDTGLIIAKLSDKYIPKFKLISDCMSIFGFYADDNEYGKHWKFANDHSFEKALTEINRIISPYGFTRYVIYWREKTDDTKCN